MDHSPSSLNYHPKINAVPSLVFIEGLNYLVLHNSVGGLEQYVRERVTFDSAMR